MRVLITGAAGAVARGVIWRLERVYDLRLADVVQSQQFTHHDWAVGSILDREFVERAVQDVQAVVHFAIARKAEDPADTTELIFDVNVKGLYLLLEACEAAGVRRFVHVSSTAPVIGHWYAGRNITVDSPYTTRGRYSLSKMLQENICEHMARNADMTIVALRPWAPCEGLTTLNDAGGEIPRPYQPGLIDTQDFGEACRLAINAQHLGKFEIFHTVATQEARERFDAQRTEQVLGFRAQQDFHSLLNSEGGG